MRNITAIHTEPSDSGHLEHITKLRWSETSTVGARGGQGNYESTREQMYDFVNTNSKQAYAISRNDDKYAFLEAVEGAHVHYVRTLPDSTKSDNLLSLPRF